MLAYNAGFPNLTIRFSWLLPISRFCTHYLGLRQVLFPRCSDCPGSFHSAQSVRTTFKIHPYYGVYFTWLPSSQLELFLSHNSLYTIFKVLRWDGFLIVRTSGHRPLLLRSRPSIQYLKPLVHKNFMNINLTVYYRLPARDSSRHRIRNYGVRLLTV